VRPPRNADPVRVREMAEELASILGMDAEHVYRRVAGEAREFLLARQVPASTADAIRAAQSRADGSLVGVIHRPVPFRVYPEGNLAAQIVGFVGAQNEGLEGVEFAFNAALSGREFDGAGEVVLTIDANVQHILERVAGQVLLDTRAESVMLMAMDPRSGDVLGSAVVPGFDPSSIRTSNPNLFRNRAATDQFEPGSVFKVFSYETVFPGGEVVRIACWNPHGHGWVTAREIITLSCNVGAAYAAELYSDHLLHRDLLNFGFGRSTGAWVNRETAGILC
jgi:cell division protein FtsI (penicillin-binding protein 3)